jgi:divalent metal cation (Fe/Co/Zn/Cd) transporter
VNPEVIDEIKEAANHTSGVEDVTDVRVRWLGHRLRAELNIAVSPELSVGGGHELAMKTKHELLHKLPFLSGVIIHIDPPIGQAFAGCGFRSGFKSKITAFRN